MALTALSRHGSMFLRVDRDRLSAPKIAGRGFDSQANRAGCPSISLHIRLWASSLRGRALLLHSRGRDFEIPLAYENRNPGSNPGLFSIETGSINWEAQYAVRKFSESESHRLSPIEKERSGFESRGRYHAALV